MPPPRTTSCSTPINPYKKKSANYSHHVNNHEQRQNQSRPPSTGTIAGSSRTTIPQSSDIATLTSKIITPIQKHRNPYEKSTHQTSQHVDDDADDETVREQTFSSAKRSLNFSNHGSNSMINPYAKRIVSDPVGMTPPRAFNEALCTDTVSPSAKRSLDFTNYGRVDNPYKRSASGSSSSMSSQNRRDAGTENSGTIDSDKTYTLYFDGGSRGNPGMAGAGMTIYDESLGTEVWSGHEYLGSNKTNNEAEYAALSTGLLCAKALGVQRIHVKGDSQLVIKQIRGEYRVNSPKLLPYYDCVMATIRDSFSLFLYPSHIPRDKNKRADALANKAMDSKTTDLSGLKEEQIITHAETIRVPPSQCTPPQDHPFDDLTDDDLCISLMSQSSIEPGNNNHDWVACLPFLVRFELSRLGLFDQIRKNDIGIKLKTALSVNMYRPKLAAELVSLIYEHQTYDVPSYEDVLKTAMNNNVVADEEDTCVLSFSALLKKTGLVLLPPEVLTKSKRIFRTFGSHRFLEVRVDPGCKQLDVLDFFGHSSRLIAGRKYGLFWAKTSMKRQTYIMFAESGVGIRASDEISSPSAAALCIPRACNPNLSIATFMKRMKLCFSDTTPSLPLETGMLEGIQDIISDVGNIMTDGCGLLSREALESVWTHYVHSKQNHENFMTMIKPGTPCPFSSFCGRIGGIKGTWIVDDRLSGIKVQYRESQKKYSVPMTYAQQGSLAGHLYGTVNSIHPFDPFYNTVDVQEWDDKPPPAMLNRGLIQILEERGVAKEYFCELAKHELESLSKVMTDRDSFHELFNARTYVTDTVNIFDDDVLFRMLKANVPINEPVMRKKMKDFAKIQLNKLLQKSKFIVERSRYLRMFPDHTGLLEQGEVYVAVGDRVVQNEINGQEHVLSMRLPSYFKGDLRKLKSVSRAELHRRCRDRSTFFDGIFVGLIISTKGHKSEAEMMSGGDFDGDKAWVCWEDEMVKHVDFSPAPNTSGDQFKISASPFKSQLVEWNQPGWSKAILDFTWHHQDDNICLGKLCKVLEILRDHPDFGFEKTDEIATKAFLQVDSPYLKQWSESDEQKYKTLPSPHWMPRKNNFVATKGMYQSRKVIGDIYTMIDGVGDLVTVEEEDEMNIHIRRVIEKAVAENPGKVEAIRKDMQRRLFEFNSSVKERISSGYEREDAGIRKRQCHTSIRTLCQRHRRAMERAYENEHLSMVFAILYEQTYFASRNRQWFSKNPYIFAWDVAHDYLTRIIADGDAQRFGVGIAPTVSRGSERSVFGKKNTNGR